MHPSNQDRHGIVTGMCFTTRHDYGLVNDDADDQTFAFSMTGMTRQEQEALYRQMNQLYDHHIHPLMRALTEILDSTNDEELVRRIQLAVKESSHG